MASEHEPASMTVRDAAAFIGVTKGWIYKNQHRLPVYRFGRSMRFKRSELAAWVEGQRQHVGHQIR